jgi:hypothetical protein
VALSMHSSLGFHWNEDIQTHTYTHTRTHTHTHTHARTRTTHLGLDGVGGKQHGGLGRAEELLAQHLLLERERRLNQMCTLSLIHTYTQSASSTPHASSARAEQGKMGACSGDDVARAHRHTHTCTCSHLLHLEVEKMLGYVLDELRLDVLGIELHEQPKIDGLYARYILHHHLRTYTRTR